MTTVTFQYETVFKTPQPPAIPPQFTGGEPPPSAPLRIVGAILAATMFCGFVVPPTPTIFVAASGGFPDFLPPLQNVQQSMGAGFVAPPVAPAAQVSPQFTGAEPPLRSSAASLVATTSSGFVTPPTPTIFASASGEFPDFLPLLRPQPAWAGFVAPPIAPAAQVSPQFTGVEPPLRSSAASLVAATTFSGFVAPPAPIAYTVTSAVDSDIVVTVNFLYQSQFNIPRQPAAAAAVVTFKGFGQFPDLLPLPLRAQSPSAAFVTPPAAITLSASRGFPDLLPALPRQAQFTPAFAFLQISYTPAALTFSQAPDQFAKSRSPSVDTQSAFSLLLTTSNPKVFGFSQSPEQILQPRKPALDTQTGLCLLRIAYTPSAFGFAQSPAINQLPTSASLLAAGSPGFVFLSTFAATPTALGFSPSPERFCRARQPGLDAYSFTSIFRAAVTPTSLAFSAYPGPGVRLAAAATPFVGFASAQTSIPATFAQSADLLWRSIAQPQPLHGFVFFSSVRVSWSFGQSPELIRTLTPLDAGIGFALASVSFAATPAVFGFSASPDKIQAPTFASLLSAGSFGFVFVPGSIAVDIGTIHITYPHRRPHGHPAVDRVAEHAAKSRAHGKPAKDRLN